MLLYSSGEYHHHNLFVAEYQSYATDHFLHSLLVFSVLAQNGSLDLGQMGSLGKTGGTTGIGTREVKLLL